MPTTSLSFTDHRFLTRAISTGVLPLPLIAIPTTSWIDAVEKFLDAASDAGVPVVALPVIAGRRVWIANGLALELPAHGIPRLRMVGTRA